MSDETKDTSATGATPAPGGKLTITRRGVLKALVSLPVLGVFAYNYLRKRAADDTRKQAILEELKVSESAPAVIPEAISRPPSRRIRLGIIGYGGEGESLVRNAGFASPEWLKHAREAHAKDPRNKDLQVYLGQDDLNVELTAVCDLFDWRAEQAIGASQIEARPGGARQSAPARRYRRYSDMLASKDVDGVIIATSDHWHAPITIAAAAAGKHVYCEKCMTRTEEETLAVHDAVTRSGIVFQLGHQNRQSESHNKAKEIIAANILGKIHLVESTTNRNTPSGAWVWVIHDQGSPRTIDWAQFQEPAPHKVPFSLERFFRWRCWYDYGTGLSGDLLSHEYDAVNQVLELGIPRSCVASGGIYHFKDGRDVPDVFQAVYEYPERDLTFVYSGTLNSNYDRGLVMMGKDGSMRVGGTLSVTADQDSRRYREKIRNGVIDTSQPMFTYRPGFKGIDAVTSATEQYFASRGLLFTYRGGRRFSPYHLMIKEWLDVIRDGGRTSCNVDRGFEEAITCHMATRAYQLGRKVEWDPVQRRIV
jgi:predicted dehydrogenase